jgi:hypothetical protein
MYEEINRGGDKKTEEKMSMQSQEKYRINTGKERINKK